MKRVTLIPQDCKDTMCHQSRLNNSKSSHSVAYNQATVHSNAKVAILFSGGVDSMVLTALADRLANNIVIYFFLLGGARCLHPSEPIDLINVAFAQKKRNDR